MSSGENANRNMLNRIDSSGSKNKSTYGYSMVIYEFAYAGNVK